MKDDNFEIFGRENCRKELDNFISDCLFAVAISCDGGRKFRTPGQAVQWYLSRLPEEKANNIRKNFRTQHLHENWNEESRLLLEEAINNSHQNSINKALKQKRAQLPKD